MKGIGVWIFGQSGGDFIRSVNANCIEAGQDAKQNLPARCVITSTNVVNDASQIFRRPLGVESIRCKPLVEGFLAIDFQPWRCQKHAENTPLPGRFFQPFGMGHGSVTWTR